MPSLDAHARFSTEFKNIPLLRHQRRALAATCAATSEDVFRASSSESMVLARFKCLS